MSSFKKILVPLDFSDCSAAALAHARMLSEKTGAQLDVLHAYDVPTFIPPHVVVMMGEVDAPLSEHAERHARAQLDAFLEANGALDDANITRRILLGPPALTLLETAEEGDYDLIVMGTHGRTGLSRLVMGSVAERVVRGATCPVLTVRHESE